MNKKSSIKKVLILVTILAVPGFLYYLLTEKGKNRYRPLEIFGPKQVAETFHTKRGVKIPDTIYHQISDFKLSNQVGASIGFPADTVQLTVVNFFFTGCTTVCPHMNNQMARVVKEYQKNPLVKFYSISVDPERDSPEVLKEYAAKFNADAKKWSFLTGDQDLIFKLARQDFLVDAVSNNTTKKEVVHSPMLILVDPKQRIRGYYDSANKEQVDKLIDEIKVQIVEELRQVTTK